MLPHKHFTIAALVIIPITFFFPEMTLFEIGTWIIVGGIISFIVDLDIIILVFLKSRKEERLKPFRELAVIYRKFNLFMDTITETGLLRTAMITHFVFSTIVILLTYVFFDAFIVPVILGIVSHLVSDIPNILRVTKRGKQ